MRPTLRFAPGLVLLSLLLALAATPAAARHAGSCPDGSFDTAELLDAEGNLIWAAVAEYPSLVRSIEDGLQTPEGLAAEIAAVDANGNGIVCIKDIWEHNGGHGAPPEPEQAAGLGGFYYFVHGIDDRP
jgi:hypothetical protein